jgi:hypothetical protein
LLLVHIEPFSPISSHSAQLAAMNVEEKELLALVEKTLKETLAHGQLGCYAAGINLDLRHHAVVACLVPVASVDRSDCSDCSASSDSWLIACFASLDWCAWLC